MWKHNLFNFSNENISKHQKTFNYIGKLFRTKEPEQVFELDKKKQLNTSDLCSLGVGSCIGTGVYIVSGLVICNFAGPATIISFILAAIASLLSGVCYAEFGVRIPQCTGTAYQYSYASIGEFIAFLIGWNLILEYMIGTAAGACAISASIDSLFSGALSTFSSSLLGLVEQNKKYHVKKTYLHTSNRFESFTHQNLPINNHSNLNSFEHYSILFNSTTYKPDFLAAFLCLIMTLILISGVKKSVKFNNYLNMFNGGVFIFLILASIPLLNIKYWQADYYNSKTSNQNTTSLKKLIKYDKMSILYRIPYEKHISNFDGNLIESYYRMKRNIIQYEQKLRTIEPTKIKNYTNVTVSKKKKFKFSSTISSTNITDNSIILSIKNKPVFDFTSKSLNTLNFPEEKKKITNKKFSIFTSSTKSKSKIDLLNTTETKEEKKEIFISEPSIKRSTTEDPNSKFILKNKTNLKKIKKIKKIKKFKKIIENNIENGFLPFGWQGVFHGAAICFYGYIGFDIIVSTGSFTESPTRSIPIAMILSTLITLIIYITATVLITLSMPNNLIDSSAALINVFSYNEMDFVKSIAALGALTSLTVAMFGSMFPMPRVVAAMAKDGLLWNKLAEINNYTGTTVFGIILLGVCTSVVAFIFPLQFLVEMMSIGTLMAYTIVSICVLMLRYQPIKSKEQENNKNTNNSLIMCFPEKYRNAIIHQEAVYQHSSLNYNSLILNSNQPKQQLQQQQQNQTTKSKLYLLNKKHVKQRINHSSFDSSEDSEEFDYSSSIITSNQNMQRVLSKEEDDEEEDDDYLVENNYNYGSVPYQYGGSSGKREFMFPFLEKFIVYWFPYGWKIPGPATEETSFFVLKLIGVYFVLVVIIVMILIFTQLTIERHLLLITFIFLIVCLMTTLFTIARQPQSKLDLKFKAPGLPYVPAFGILINIYLIFKLSYLTLIRFIIWIFLGFLIYFCYGIKNSSLETSNNLNDSSQFIRQPYLESSTQMTYNKNFDLLVRQNQQIELINRNKSDFNPFLNNFSPSINCFSNDFKNTSNAIEYSNKNPFLTTNELIQNEEHEFNIK